MLVIGLALGCYLIGVWVGYLYGYEVRKEEDNEYWGTDR